MAIDKLIPQYLNSDTDQKLVKSVEMTDNLNIRVSEDDAGTGGVIKNVKGTDVVGPKRTSDTFPAGDNRVIGSVANEKNKEMGLRSHVSGSIKNLNLKEEIDRNPSRESGSTILALSRIHNPGCESDPDPQP